MSCSGPTRRHVCTFPSNFWMIFLPPFRAICSASSSLPLMSLIWASRPFFTLSRWRVCSCSRRSSSPTRANFRELHHPFKMHALHPCSYNILVDTSCLLPRSWPSWSCPWILSALLAAPRAPAAESGDPPPASSSRSEPTGTEHMRANVERVMSLRWSFSWRLCRAPKQRASMHHLVVEVTVFLVGILQLGLQGLASPLRGLQGCASLLPFADQYAATSFHGRLLLPAVLVAPDLLLQLSLQLLGQGTATVWGSLQGKQQNKHPVASHQTLICCCIFLLFLPCSALFLVSRSTCSSSSLMSASSFFFSFRPSALPFTSTSRLACRDSSALWWLFLAEEEERDGSGYYKAFMYPCRDGAESVMKQALPLKITNNDFWRNKGR